MRIQVSVGKYSNFKARLWAILSGFASILDGAVVVVTFGSLHLNLRTVCTMNMARAEAGIKSTVK